LTSLENFCADVMCGMEWKWRFLRAFQRGGIPSPMGNSQQGSTKVEYSFTTTLNILSIQPLVGTGFGPGHYQSRHHKSL
jgi:hypothetical protein